LLPSLLLTFPVDYCDAAFATPPIIKRLPKVKLFEVSRQAGFNDEVDGVGSASSLSNNGGSLANTFA
jgi:hypothetical protein